MSFFITHEDDNLDEYTGFFLEGGGTVSTSSASAMGGTSFGLQSTLTMDSDRGVAYLDYAAFSGTSYTITFWFDPNSISMPAINPTDWDDEDVTILRLSDAGSSRLFIELQWNGSNYIIRCCIRNDGLATVCTNDITIFNDAQFIQFTVRKAATSGSNDGSLELKINGIIKGTISDIDLFNRYDDPTRIQVGLDNIVSEPNISGTCYYDEIFGQSYSGDPVAIAGKLRTPDAVIEGQGESAPGGAGGGSGGSIACVSSDGGSVYIATFNSFGTPELIKISAFLNADGTVIFNPGEGGRIGVQCSPFNSDTIWIGGQFDGTNVIEKSTDGGSSFVVKDDGTFGVIRSFVVGPDDENRVIVFDGDNGDIIQTLDGGETWTAINTAVTQLVNSIARFDQNAEETVFGNQGDATDSINYSPNSGADLEDYQTGVYPNANATKVIAN